MKISAIVLAAGEGTRLNEGQPSPKAKVLYEVGGKPMLFYSLDILKNLNIDDVVIVVGHLQNQVKNAVRGKVKFVVQEKANGTGEAVRLGLGQIQDADFVLVLYGADIYREDVIKKLIDDNLEQTVSFLTTERSDPTGLGRIVRDESGNVKAIVEEKVASEEEKLLKEVNDGGYLFNKEWLENSIEKLHLTKVNEYFLTDLVELAVKENKKVMAQKIEGEGWFGVDTPEQVKKTSDYVEKNWR